MTCPRCGGTERYRNGRCAPCTRACNLRWKKAHPDRHLAGNQRWEAANAGAVRANQREYGRRNKLARAEYKKRWRAENPERHVADFQARRARKVSNGGSYTVGEWLSLCQSYGNRCLRCGRADVKLTVDHVIPVIDGGRNEISNIQPLCGPCNSIKGTRATDYRLRRERADVPEQLDLFGDAA